jgi:hypothetical protein
VALDPRLAAVGVEGLIAAEDKVLLFGQAPAHLGEVLTSHAAPGDSVFAIGVTKIGYAP